MVRHRVGKTSATTGSAATRKGPFGVIGVEFPGLSLEERFADFLHSLETNPELPLTLREAARSLGISRASLTRLFGRKIGESFVRHCNRLRLIRAAQLLATTSKPIASIASEVGFCDQSYFGLLFRRYFGLTPGEFRKRQADARD